MLSNWELTSTVKEYAHVICEKIEVPVTNISGVIAQYIDAPVCKIWSFYKNIWGFTDNNVAKI